MTNQWRNLVKDKESILTSSSYDRCYCRVYLFIVIFYHLGHFFPIIGEKYFCLFVRMHVSTHIHTMW